VIYPNSTPDFRILIKENGTQILQVRYVNITQGYKSTWKDVPVITENDKTDNANASSNL